MIPEPTLKRGIFWIQHDQCGHSEWNIAIGSASEYLSRNRLERAESLSGKKVKLALLKQILVAATESLLQDWHCYEYADEGIWAAALLASRGTKAWISPRRSWLSRGYRTGYAMRWGQNTSLKHDFLTALREPWIYLTEDLDLSF